MKLVNRETGEIGYLYANKNENYIVLDENDEVLAVYETLEAVVGEWQDYEEPKSGIKDVWFPDVIEGRNNVVISFETREEAKNAVLKLKALERLRKNGFRFDGFRQDYTRWSSGQDAFRDGKRYIHFNKADDDDWLKENWEDLKLVFKEEE